MSVGMIDMAYTVDIPRCWCDHVGFNSNVTYRDTYTWIVFIVVNRVVLHACLGVSKSSRIQVSNRLSNNITDGGTS